MIYKSFGGGNFFTKKYHVYKKISKGLTSLKSYSTCCILFLAKHLVTKLLRIFCVWEELAMIYSFQYACPLEIFI